MDKIKFEAEIDFGSSPSQVKIKAIESPWAYFGYLLEVMAFMPKNCYGSRGKDQRRGC